MEKFDKKNPYNPKSENPDGKKAAIKIIVFLIATLFFVIKCGCREEDKAKDKPKKYSKMDALVQAHVFVKSQLKSPSSAEFEGGTDGVIQTNDTIFTVIGTVDSQNSFGAMLRSNYSCKVIFHPKDDTHNIENFILQ